MIVRFLEAFFRHKWLIVLPAVLMPLIVTPIALLTAPSYYESTASVWVDRATYLPGDSDGFNPYMSPSQNQINRLNDQLRTRTFLMDIAQRSPLAGVVGNPAAEERFATMFFRGFGMMSVGERVLMIRFRGSNPQLAAQMVEATVAAYKDKITTDRLNQAQLATGFYETRLQAAEAELAKANDSLRRYVAANPRLTTIDPNAGAAATGAARLGLPAGAIDPQIAELLRQVDLQTEEVTRIRTSLESARLDTSAAIQGQEVGFQVVDQAQVPSRPTRERKKALIFPAAAAVAGMGLSAALLVVLVATDRTVRSEQDLLQFGRVVGAVPRLRLKNLTRKDDHEATRRAIGFAAGALAPAPSGAK
jgi:uncharacterized protein involved in exopolysaccharide biosynthesis